MASIYRRKSKDGKRIDLEKFAVSLLSKSLTTKAAGATRSAKERLAYATSLATFAPTKAGKLAIANAKLVLQKEIDSSADPRKREQLRVILQTVSK